VLFDLTEARTIVADAIRHLRAAHVPVPRLEVLAESFLKATHAAAKGDELWDQTLRERDRYHEVADDLAQAIAKHLDVDIGEHSSANCPWDEALEAIAQAPAVVETARAAALEQAAQVGFHAAHNGIQVAAAIRALKAVT
jgi:hypothetical protein